MRSGIPKSNAVDDAVLHKSILEFLIKEKIMKVNKNNESRIHRASEAFKSLFEKNIYQKRCKEEQKIKISIVPVETYFQNCSFLSDESLIQNVEIPNTLQNGLESISLYNIEITGDHLIEYDINPNKLNHLNFSNVQCKTNDFFNTNEFDQSNVSSKKENVHSYGGSDIKLIEENCSFQINTPCIRHQNGSLESIPKSYIQGYCLNNSHNVTLGMYSKFI